MGHCLTPQSLNKAQGRETKGGFKFVTQSTFAETVACKHYENVTKCFFNMKGCMLASLLRK
jgi:hypothetical protein